ncbi:Pyrrolidone-carboxylate peptidase, putative [Perkinsus marinus ATCC 50983]|uniref:Pyrrolidone-carboxylate peptidase, putative n=1 Tax=Perkinsus marinus (strain ATCC 50983 / TXsc) TaxID=423536 RepID=C5KHG6_PERM5|nr:Pyrrolidone-carboxylate peptidase, putative [Perkinsus marinus ATCC 50983]EER16028.1 Pyrrolidone-carboxylate peptidase, putative [Perkinsus marinus ATCC 50983]|eukprot:XP_002784232.1 Pyrrolidone-carboxylate peptidase, putative [Perkinsus marinus ATCC 50983]
MDTSISTITVPLLPDTISVRRKERLFGHNYSTFGAPLVHSSGLRKWVCGALLLFVLVIAGYLVCIRKVDGYTDHQSSIPASADTARLTSLRVSAAAFSAPPQERSVVWVTGYQPFEDFTFNPSEAVAKSLNGSCTSHYCIQAFSLPVTHGGASQPARWLREADVHKPAAIVHLGLEDRAKGLKLEVAAKNILAESNSSLPILPNVTSILPSTANLGLVNGIDSDEMWSVDAGSFYCNEIYFRTLSEIRSRNLNIPAIFVHLPEPTVMSLEEDGRLIRRLISQLLAVDVRV